MDDANEKVFCRNSGYKCLKTKKCKYNCGAVLYMSETDGWCCQRGNIKANLESYLPHFFNEIDENLLDIYFSDVDFQRTIRQVNKLFCFSSMATDPSGTFDTKNDVRLNHNSVVTMTGRTYHRVFDVHDQTHRAKNNPMRWYLLDPNDRTTEAESRNLRNDAYKALDTYIKTHNHIAKEIVKIPANDHKTCTVALRYGPAAKEIAAVYIDDERNVTSREFVYCRRNSEKPIQVSTLTGLYEQLQYPCLFPDGNFGWDLFFKQQCGTTQMCYYRFQICYRLALRENIKFDNLTELFDASKDDYPPRPPSYAHWTMTNRLFNEYLVDMYSRMVDERIFMWRSSTIQNRIASYREYDECINDSRDTTDIGRVYLPANVNGSYRKSRMQVHNALHLVNKKGKTHFFVTLTCNPLWPDIQRQLHKDQKWNDRPDVVCRVFKQRLEDFLKKLSYGHFFDGAIPVYIVRVVEFQGRGLPHAHIAVRMNFAEDADLFKYISATVPYINKFSSQREKRIHSLVVKHNIHKNDGCLCTQGASTPHPCRAEGSVYCSKSFPKQYSTSTGFDDRGYPIYVRINPEDLFVVPYNEDITEYWDGHVK